MPSTCQGEPGKLGPPGCFQSTQRKGLKSPKPPGRGGLTSLVSDTFTITCRFLPRRLTRYLLRCSPPGYPPSLTSGSWIGRFMTQCRISRSYVAHPSSSSECSGASGSSHTVYRQGPWMRCIRGLLRCRSVRVCSKSGRRAVRADSMRA